MILPLNDLSAILSLQPTHLEGFCHWTRGEKSVSPLFTFPCTFPVAAVNQQMERACSKYRSGVCTQWRTGISSPCWMPVCTLLLSIWAPQCSGEMEHQSLAAVANTIAHPDIVFPSVLIPCPPGSSLLRPGTLPNKHLNACFLSQALFFWRGGGN